MPARSTSPAAVRSLRRWLGIEIDEVSAREKLASAVGGAVAIAALVAVTTDVLDLGGALAVIASAGASAVLLFAVPHGQLSQPWPVAGGHLVSAAVGVTAARVVGPTWLAAGLAVGVAIGAMHVLKCIHPPGGASALAAVLGGPAVRDLGYGFVLRPVGLDVAILLGVALAFNGLVPWRRYPAAAGPPPVSAAVGPTHEEVLAALRSFDSFIDINEDDLVRLVHLLAGHAADGGPVAGRAGGDAGAPPDAG